ncbi:MAG: hypothetical protein LBJ62_02845 [Bifidobacteriaceae bacterium]|jgi:hypothetical protein|nr:hypothetical protein [Bifidobacteriaceae bacterium]
MALFKRKGHRAGQIGGVRPEMVRQAVMGELAKRGRDGRITTEEGHDYVVFSGDQFYSLNRLYATAAQTTPKDLAEMIERWVDSTLAVIDLPDPAEMDAAELRQRIRTRLISSMYGGLEPYPYARRPFSLVGQILCLDYSEALLRLTEDSVDNLALPLDELFAQGQANTDAEPFDQHVALDDSGQIWEITGESVFIASKAANLAALVPAVTGPAPFGLAFAIPRSNTLVYQIIRDGWAIALNQFAQLTWAMGKRSAEEGDWVCPYAFYYAPDGIVELLSLPPQDPSSDKIRLNIDGAIAEHVVNHPAGPRP